MRRHVELGCLVEKLPLRGRSILVVEDEPLIALHIADCFRQAGAAVYSAHNLQDGLRLAGHPDLCAAIVDFGLGDGNGVGLCEHLRERGIPFVLHTGYTNPSEACGADIVVPKPADPSDLVTTITRLIRPEQGTS